jgi:hypothetical protein
MPRGPGIALFLLLLLLALIQALYEFRTEIAIRLPQTRPLLERACATIGCDIPLPRKAQLLSIDDSDLQEHPDHKEVYVLTATIVNRAPYTQAYPDLELTLTDLHDQPVLRRTLAPADYLPKGTPLETGLAAGADVRVTLDFTAPGVPATGYRVFVSYP